MTYVRMIEDARGDLVDIEHYCDAVCYRAGTGDDPFGHHWPCPESADYDQHCPYCSAVSVPGIDSDYLRDAKQFASERRDALASFDADYMKGEGS